MTHTIAVFNGAELDHSKSPDALGGGWSLDSVRTFYSQRAYKWIGASGGWWNQPCAFNADGTVAVSYQPEHWAAFHLYIESLPTAGNYGYLYALWDVPGNAVRASFRVTETGAVQVWNGSAWGASSANVLSVGKWYQISFHFKQNTETRVIARDVDTIAELINQSATGYNATIAYPRFGAGYTGAPGASVGTYHMDNLVIEHGAVGAVDDPFLLLGVTFAEWALLPTGDGTDNLNYTGSYLDVDEVPADDDTTYRSIAYASGQFTSHVTDVENAGAYPVASVASVGAQIRARRNTGSGAASFVRLRRGVTVSETAAAYAAATYAWQYKYWQTDPTDGQPWTTTRVKEVELGARCDAGAGGSRCTAAYGTVLVAIQTSPVLQQRLVHYTLDENDPYQTILDNNGRPVPPEELRANRWLQLLGGRRPTSKVFGDFVDDPSMVPLKVVNFTEPDQYSLGSASDDLLEAILGGITGRVL